MSTVTIRTDTETDIALEALTRDGRSKSDAIREAVLLAYRQQASVALRAEAEAAAADPADRAEIRAVREELDADGAW